MAAAILSIGKKRPSRLQRFRSSPNFVLITVCVAIFNDVFLFGTIIPVLPYALPHRVNINPQDVQIWIAVLLAMYGGALLIGSLLFGWVGDKLPRRYGIFLFGIVCLLAATALLAFGRHIVLLIIGRFFQGLAAAVVWTSGLALLTDIFGQGRYGEAIGYGQTAVSIGTTSSPLMGGLVYSRGGYRAVSIMSIGVVVLSLLLALIMVEPEPEPTKREQTDANAYPNGTGQNGDAGMPNGTKHHRPSIDEEDQISDSPDENTSLIPKPSKKTKTMNRPAYPLLLSSTRILAAMSGIFTYSFVIISFEGLIPLFVKETFHWDSAHAALIFLCWIIPGLLGPIAGRASDKLGPRWIAVGGFLFAAPPLILMRLIDKNDTEQKVVLCVLLTLVGFGLVWVMAPCISDLTAAAAELKEKYPDRFGDAGALTQAFGLFVCAYSFGTFAGPSVAGVIKAKLNWGAATAILGSVCIAVCIPITLRTSALRKSSSNS